MRHIFLGLLLANVVFFVWARWVAQPRDLAAAAPDAASLPTLELTAVPTSPPPAAVPLASAAPAVRCKSIGPFADTAAANAASESLRSHGWQPRQRNVESSVPDGYWVYVEDLKDTASRRKVIAALNSAGIKDAAAMDEGERVSVGVFSDQRHAVHRAEQVQELGFKPTLSVHQRATNAPWLDVEIKASDSEPLPDSFNAGGAKTAEAIRVIDCPAKAASG